MTDAGTRWWLIRHAPVPLAGKIVYGAMDVAADLSDRDALAAVAKKLPDGAVWVTSPLSRARDTASALREARRFDTEPLIEPALAEQDFGDWEGRSTDEVWSTVSREQWTRAARIAPPGGETFLALVERVNGAVARINRRFAGRDIVAVLHAGSIRAALAAHLEGGADAALVRAVAPLSLSRIDWDAAGATIRYVNRLKR